MVAVGLGEGDITGTGGFVTGVTGTGGATGFGGGGGMVMLQGSETRPTTLGFAFRVSGDFVPKDMTPRATPRIIPRAMTTVRVFLLRGLLVVSASEDQSSFAPNSLVPSTAL